MNIIKRVRLKNFRCHDEFDLDCDRPVTLIIGENGSGKTSVLEAIYMALRGKSFKAVDRDIKRHDAEFFRAEIDLYDAQKVIIRYSEQPFKKEFEIDGKKTVRLPKKNRYPVVLFEPNNIYLIESSPSRRRDYFDELYKQINDSYTVILGKYNKALKQRNDLLKLETVSRDDLFSWNILCAQYGTKLREFRNETIKKINKYITENYQSIAKNDDRCSIKYTGKIITENEYLKELEKVKPVVVCGDFNAAHEEIDIARPQTNHHSAGFTDEERRGITNLVSAGLLDTFRVLHPDEVRYTWWSHWGHARANNVGWRIDYFFISKKLRDCLKSAEIHEDVMGSDHCPASIELEF